ELPLDRVAHLFRVVLDDRPADDVVAGSLQQLRNRAAARVGGFGPCVAHGDDVAADRARSVGLVLNMTHDGIVAPACYDSRSACGHAGTASAGLTRDQQ